MDFLRSPATELVSESRRKKVSKRNRTNSSKVLQQRRSSQTKRNTSSSSSKKLKLMTAELKNIEEWNTQQKLRTNFYKNVPNCYKDDDIIKNNQIIPQQIATQQDYAIWLGIREDLSKVGRERFRLLTQYAEQCFGKEAVAKIDPDYSGLRNQGPLIAKAPIDPYAQDDDAENDSTANRQAIGDEIDVSPYVASIKAAQSQQTTEVREKYRQLALKEADQRQLLMLLCGDVEASMFFDKLGQIRHPEQIIEHILFLLKPYRMGNTLVGEIMQWCNYTVNLVWKMSHTAVMVVVTFSMIMLIVDLIHRLIKELNNDTSELARFYHLSLRSLLWLLKTMWNYIVWVFVKNYLPGIRITKIEYKGWFKTLCTYGGPTLIFMILAKHKLDYKQRERLKALQYASRLVTDRYRQLQAMNYLAELTPGILGEDISSGITVKQLGLMASVQEQLIQLDKEVDEMSKDKMAKLIDFFVRREQLELTDLKIELGGLLMSRYQASTSTEDENVQEFRKLLLETYPHEIRCFHLLDAYGHPRNVTDICKVFFVYWKRARESQLIPSIPHQGSSITRWFKSTPIERSKLNQKLKRSSRSAERQNIPMGEWWRQHPFLYNKIKTPISLRYALQEQPTNYAATLGDAVDDIKQYPGWTHRISKFAIDSLVEKFHLSVERLEDEYEQYVELRIKGEGVKHAPI